MEYSVMKATSWVEVEIAAKAAETCIRPNAGSKESWQVAKCTWDQHALGSNPNLIYFLICVPYCPPDGPIEKVIKGYMRLFRINEKEDTHPMWAIDLTRPFAYTPVILAAQQMAPATLVIKRFSTTDDICVRHWPVISATYPRLNTYLDHRQNGQEDDWLVVMP